MARLPRDRSPDSTLAFARDGYEFITNRCNRYRSDVFATRLLLRPVICMRGAEAAELFYSDRFQRQGATPAAVRRTLFGDGGVQGLDDAAHHHRKQLFMSLMTPDSIDDLVDRFTQAWRTAALNWSGRDEIVLYDEAARLLCRTVSDWAGVPIPEAEVPRRTADLVAMFDPLVPPGVPYWNARRARVRTERWISDLIEAVRRGDVQPSTGSALDVVALHKDPDGRRLSPQVAAVELINLLRPTVAVTHFIVFAALALEEHPHWERRLQADGDDVEWFVQEVRRHSPFFPTAAARVRDDFEWHGARFPQDQLVLLDLYGTNRHPDLWDEPDEFRPERFASWEGDPYTFIPQGGGDHHTGHRCPGEWITIRLLQAAVALLARETTYLVPPQDLHVSLSRVPARPRSGFVLRDVQSVESAA